jgi:hypothetical protein
MSGMMFDGKNEAAMSQATTIEGGQQSCETVDISDTVHKPECFCLNQNADHPFENILLGADPEALLKSDADEQLLMHFGFKEPVRLHAIDLSAPVTGEAPKHVKIYVNRLNMGFDDCDGAVPCAFELDMTPALLAPGVLIELPAGGVKVCVSFVSQSHQTFIRRSALSSCLSAVSRRVRLSLSLSFRREDAVRLSKEQLSRCV